MDKTIYRVDVETSEGEKAYQLNSKEMEAQIKGIMHNCAMQNGNIRIITNKELVLAVNYSILKKFMS